MSPPGRPRQSARCRLFDVARFPKLRFASKKVEKSGDGRYRISGDLTIRDVTRMNRRHAVKQLAALVTLLPPGCRRFGAGRGGAGGVNDEESTMSTTTAAASGGNQTTKGGRMPVVFVGHGSPMNVIERNRWSEGFAALAELLPRPKAILAISAHWFVPGTYLTANATPKTIHDFSGFPPELYEIHYRAPGSADLAGRVRQLVGTQRAAMSTEWGLDHGTWSVLRWMFPAADIPVVQLSIDHRLDVRGHHELGRSLAELREEGVLVLGSGNIVHNLRDAFGRMQTGATDTPEWARRYDESTKAMLLQHDGQALVSLWPSSEHGRRAHPSPDHWLPLIYAQAASDDRDRVTFPTEGFDLGSVSMRNVVFG